MKSISQNLVDNRQIRVFISSTFRDMQDERDELMKKTFPMLRQMAAERDVTLTEIDLRWGITEEESKSGKVVEICLREIENSVPFFIGIIGNRYGWIPKIEDIGGGSLPERFPKVPEYVERHLSVTEMEMQFGVLARPENMHAYFFIKEPEIPDEEEPEKLDALKKAVRANKRYPVSTYSSREDLARQVEDAFRKLLDDLFPEGALSALEKESLGQRAYMNSLCQIYIRTEKNFAALDEWMEDWEKHQLVITGASGLGKSALVANWTKDKLTREKALPYTIIYHAVGSGGSLGSDWHVVKSLCDEIRDLYGFDTDETSGTIETSPKTDEKALQELFDRVAFEGDKPLLIVLDAINQIIDVNHSKRLNWLPIPPKNVKILFTTLEADETMQVFRDRHYPVFTLRPLTRRERIRMVRKYLSIFSKKLKPEQVARIVDDRQSDNTLVMKTLLDELVNFGIYEKLDEKIEEFLKPDSYEDFYQVLLQNYETSFGEQRVRHFLSLVAVSRNGLSEDEILSITQEKPLHWSQFFCSFRQHLIVKNGLVSFSHGYIREAVEGRYIKETEEWVRSCREGIVAALINQKTPEGKKTMRSMDEVPYQLDLLGSMERLHEYLLDLEVFSYLYKKEETTLGAYWWKLIDTGYYMLEEYLTEIDRCADNIGISTISYLSSFTRNTVVNPRLSLQFIEKALQYVKNEKEKADVYNRMGLSYNLLGDYQKALEYIEKAIQIYLSMAPGSSGFEVDGNLVFFGEMHPVVANCYINVGIAYGKLGFHYKALEYAGKATYYLWLILGEQHPTVAKAYHHLGLEYSFDYDYQKALEYMEKALRIRLALFGERHPDVAQSYDDIGHTYKEIGDDQKALEYKEKALRIRLALFGERHPDVAQSYDDVGWEYLMRDNRQKWLEYIEKAIQIWLSVFGEHHPDGALAYKKVAPSCDVVGWEYADLGDLKKALDYCDDVGWEYADLGDHKKALDYMEKALRIRLSLFGECHPDVVRSYDYVGIEYGELGDHEKELEYCLKALEIVQVIKDDYLEATIHKRLGRTYERMGMKDKAMVEYRLAAEMFKAMGMEEEYTQNQSLYDSLNA